MASPDGFENNKKKSTSKGVSKRSKSSVRTKGKARIVVFLANLLMIGQKVEITSNHLEYYPEDEDDICFVLCAENGNATHLVSYDKQFYIIQKDRKKREKLLRHFVANDLLWAKDTREKDANVLRDMVSNNILYFDPTEAVYYPQGKSYWWGIKSYFKSIAR
jgi:hypothetical protein